MIFFLSVFPALAFEKPLLTKRRKPKPPNSACAEFVGFVPLQRKTQCLRQNLVAKAAKTGYCRQMKTAYGYLKENPSARIFSIGGGCDADVPVISHLNKLYDGNLFVLWLDAHGDLNSPEESKTGLFYGMPARILIDGRDIFPDIIERPLMPHQIIHIGGRDFDKPELGYIKKITYSVFPVFPQNT